MSRTNHQQQNATTKTSSVNKKMVNLNNKAFRFEEYMPLCKVQNMLDKGQVVEVNS